jgi:pimeloyl-ACP methyl ester carboxylesterase
VLLGSTWEIIEHAGHNLHIETAAELAQIVLEFLRRAGREV